MPESPLRPRHISIPAAVAYSGFARTALYLKAAATPGLFVKDGARTLVVLDVLDRIMDARPAAVIKSGAVS